MPSILRFLTETARKPEFLSCPRKEVLVLTGLFIFGFLCVSWIEYSGEAARDRQEVPEAEIVVQEFLNPVEYRAAVLASARQKDSILEFYRDQAFRERVVFFFGAITHSEEIAAQVLALTAENDISPSLVFALMWEESRFNPGAVNRNANNSIDRGLFQLNSASFPSLKVEDFFNTGVNIRYGLAHLKMCLDQAGSEVAALAMYNAGLNRVRSGATPERTLNYINRILSYRQGIEKLFLSECMRPSLAEAGPPEIP
ncbi:MAG: lytic transglycosylase domain-containing protein [Spirochaetaceae bacterium]|nr:lytic transglycosylase domain-containing protein [Spirochaetaceae bacterium]